MSFTYPTSSPASAKGSPRFSSSFYTCPSTAPRLLLAAPAHCPLPALGMSRTYSGLFPTETMENPGRVNMDTPRRRDGPSSHQGRKGTETDLAHGMNSVCTPSSMDFKSSILPANVILGLCASPILPPSYLTSLANHWRRKCVHEVSKVQAGERREGCTHPAR